ncbi:MAG TPA: D-amino acid dehydrogenase [Gammaproteobacteria bacterium]|jgi:D-amino-acid dehydrogenase
MARTALVIGGGLLGVTSAWYLQERGFAVTVLERRDATALETSYANGGLITPSQSDPWNAPGTPMQLLKWLGREDSPLLLRASAIPGMWRWGLKFLLSSRMQSWWPATEANLRLGLYSAASLRELRDELKLDYRHMSRGTLKVFRNEEYLEESSLLARSLAPQGLNHRLLSPEEAVQLEPLLGAMSGELAGAIHYPDDESGDAHLFTRALESHARRAGVQFRFGTQITGFVPGAGNISGIKAGRELLQADVYVLAAASHSPRLVAPLGITLPVYPVKGYSVTFPSAGVVLGLPLVDFEQKIVMTPIGDELRVAGTAEFAGFDTEANPRRGANIVHQAMRLLPQLAGRVKPEDIRYWNGLRPMTADGPPLVSRTRYRNLFINTGHGPLGWTLAAGSSRALADLVAGRESGFDLDAYSVERFA